MKKTTFRIDYTFDFELFGLISTARGYKLAWELNNALKVNLIRQPDLLVGFRNTGEKAFPFYAHESLHNRLKLFKNRASENDSGKYFLIPEFPHFDFIILAAMEEKDAHQHLLTQVRSIPSVQMVHAIPLDGLKSKSNFIF